MFSRPTSPSVTRRLDLEAARWLVRRDRDLSPAEQDEFLQWLAADPRHSEWFSRHLQTWQELNLLIEWRPEHSTEPNPDLLARPHAGPRRFWSLALALAAGVAVASFVAWRPEIDRNPARALPTRSPATVLDYQCRVLDDGSVVELDRGATIAVEFTPAERRVRLLQGQAFFTVARNPGRAFVVHAGGVLVRAIGTAFGMKLDAHSVEVLVTAGQVQVDSARTATPDRPVAVRLLTAGQRTIVSLGPDASPPQFTEVSTDEQARLLAWQPKLLDFNSTPLAGVAAEFNRHNRVQLVIEDLALNAVPIVASFRSNNVDGFVRLLELTAGVQAERDGDTIRLRRAR